MAGVRVKSVTAGHGADHAGLEPRGFQQHAPRVHVHFGALAAHETRQGDGSTVIGDDQVLFGEVPFHAIQRDDFLADFRIPDNKSAL